MSRESFSVEYSPERGARRAIEFVPRTDEDGWLRITKEWTGCDWRETGREQVSDVVAFDTAEVIE